MNYKFFIEYLPNFFLKKVKGWGLQIKSFKIYFFEIRFLNDLTRVFSVIFSWKFISEKITIWIFIPQMHFLWKSRFSCQNNFYIGLKFGTSKTSKSVIFFVSLRIFWCFWCSKFKSDTKIILTWKATFSQKMHLGDENSYRNHLKNKFSRKKHRKNSS